MTALLLTGATLLSTLAGGLFSLKFRDRLHFILSFTAGVMLGMVCFELLPEVFELAREQGIEGSHAMLGLVVGFLFLHAVEKLVLVHHAHEADYAAHRHPRVGVLTAAALVVHSFLDGVGIGLAFQVSNGVGIAVAVAVVAHDFSDGLNTVSLMLSHGNNARRAKFMLALDALAPLAGAASTLLFAVPPGALLVYLAFFAGFLLYIGAADVLPEAHSRAGPGMGLGLIGLTCLGAAFMYVVVRLAG
ncbi:MAG TPA: ZIP family metal transporter [Burkholderiales bacterium]|nr:ZIP family metal transporter [Burkholderiales bacterium]